MSSQIDFINGIYKMITYPTMIISFNIAYDSQRKNLQHKHGCIGDITRIYVGMMVLMDV